MSKIKDKHFFIVILAICAICETLSFIGFFNPLVVNIAAALIVLGTVILSLKDPAYGFIVLLGELLIGSQGYLLWFGNSDNRLSLRIALWIIVMTMWLTREGFKLIRSKNFSALSSFSYYLPFGLLCVVIAGAAINGYFSGNDSSLIFIEAKRWLYILAVIPIVILFKNTEKRQKLYLVLAACGLWIAIKTFIFLYIFSHGLPISETIYSWTRNDLLGEITRLPNGFSRVFLQSQVFAIPAFLFSLAFFLKNLVEKKWKLTKVALLHAGAAVLFLSVILTSLSRSFWVGTALASAIGALLVLFVLRPKIKYICISGAYCLLVGFLSTAFLFLVVGFPYPKPLADINSSLLTDRATEFEAGAASRWALFPVMRQAISNRPVMGYGLGKTLTYKTSDPRIKQSSVNGEDTTNSFEWGWLDLWLKLGLLGIIAYIWFLALIITNAWQRLKESPDIAIAAITAVIALAALHFFTPYLNHPLGFGYLAALMIAVGFKKSSLA